MRLLQTAAMWLQLTADVASALSTGAPRGAGEAARVRRSRRASLRTV